MYKYILLLHILGATIWTGGHLILSFVILPKALRKRSVEIVNNFGCTGQDETLVEEDCQARIEAPTAFRPGSGVTVLNRPDLSNSDFWVYGYFIEELSFQIFIYNRWGEIVFQSDDINFRWNGGYKNNQGQLLPAGTYTYVVRYKSKYSGGVKEQRGGVVLMR